MISGVGGAGVVAPGRRRLSPWYGGRKLSPAFAIAKRSLCTRCAMVDNARLESSSAPSLAWETVNLRDISTSGGAMGGGTPFGRRRLIGEIADAVVQGGGSGGVEAAVQSEDAGQSSKGGEFGTGFRFDIVIKGINDIKKQAEILKEEVTSFDYSISPTPYSPVEGFDAFRFALLCALLLFVFWLGNYYVPDLIFKDTVFRKEPENPLDPTDRTSGDNKLAVSNQHSPEGSPDVSKNNVADGESSTGRKAGTGFGQSKQKRLKSTKRK